MHIENQTNFLESLKKQFKDNDGSTFLRQLVDRFFIMTIEVRTGLNSYAFVPNKVSIIQPVKGKANFLITREYRENITGKKISLSIFVNPREDGGWSLFDLFIDEYHNNEVVQQSQGSWRHVDIESDVFTTSSPLYLFVKPLMHNTNMIYHGSNVNSRKVVDLNSKEFEGGKLKMEKIYLQRQLSRAHFLLHSSN